MHALFLISLVLPLVSAAPARRATPAPLLKPRDGTIIENKYIVKLTDSIKAAGVDEALNLFKADADHVYDAEGFKGFSGHLESDELTALLNHPDVEFIEHDAEVTTQAYTTQTGATWGITRISHKSRTATGYTYDTSAGEGTCSYIIDTGIYTTHSDFGGRATFLANYASDSTTGDGNGHGTHVAGTVGSTTYGVAKKTKLYAVRVLNASGSGTNSGVIAGMNFVATDSQTRSCPAGSVANMSLGGGYSAAVNDAATALVNAGVFLAVAAGNSAANAANYSPASAAAACTVGATTSTDAIASYSNYGALVDIFAPGSSITSTWNNGGTNSISGTSMASPHVAGLGAYLLALEGPRTPAALCTRIKALAQTGVLSGIPSSTVNQLAFNGNPSD
ncbi:subtilisin-like serine protease-like protein PR1A [Microdochium trichocladiopsis]|uniref:Subtilisin-like serine protease-like protein PR1A n=1 Tax=Microdochium trichocladiopsis TaxID=1682393 RepID=A0A9P9BSA5_9PEZI|nr:subtilisin-like serine protease-like protein PR1A [Microdochium trichocladiopsis]KAH7034545.1 subtilisin-like serine protease-like protein PR1A [Microdochium trichocladiopsis]